MVHNSIGRTVHFSLDKSKYKVGQELDKEIIQMKKAELYAKLEAAAEEEKEKIIAELELLTNK